MEEKESAINVWTWNVRTLIRSEKLENIERGMDKGMIIILGLYEVSWKDGGDYWSEGYRVTYISEYSPPP